MPTDPTKADSATRNNPSHRRERSTRYPGVPLSECLKICESIAELGVDGLTSADIASSLGYKSIKTNTFSARLSGSRQFGLLELKGEGYHLSALAKEILHPVDLSDLPRLHRAAFLKPPLYAELAERFDGKKLPDAAILGNVLYHSHQIIATAKQAAAEAFLESARYCGMLGDDSVLHVEGVGQTPAVVVSAVVPAVVESPDPASALPAAPRRTKSLDARLDLQLWDDDEGKTIRLRAPRSISAASYERFLQAFRLVVRVEEGGGS